MYTQETYDKLKERQENNHHTITGDLAEPFTHAYASKHGGHYYQGMVKVPRPGSKNSDTLRILAAAYQLEYAGISPDDASTVGMKVTLSGPIRTNRYYCKELDKHVMGITIHATDEFKKAAEDDPYQNEGTLIGYLRNVKEPRTTKVSSRVITDFSCRVPRGKKGDADTIPCIAWETCSRIIPAIDGETLVHLNGHLQCRDYKKTLEDGTKIKRTTYEFSVNRVVEEN